MRIISRSSLMRFVSSLQGHDDQISVRASLDAWFEEVRRAKWKTSADIKASYASASIVGADRAIFNIRGNRYRLVVAVNYRNGIVFIKWLGTHKAYDKIDARTVEYEPEAN